MQIVIAWAEKTLPVPTGRFVTRDANLFPEHRFDWEARAAMWLRKGTEADVEKARACAARDGGTVFTFAETERDALAKARSMAVEIVRGAA